MKKFVFTLETLQSTRQMQEKELKKELADIQSRLAGQQQILDNIPQEIAELCRTWQAQMAAGTNASSIQQFNQSYSLLLERQHNQQALVKRIEKEKADCQDRLVNLLTEIKSLDNLKEQQLAFYKQNAAKELENEMGEFVSFHRKPVMTANG